MKYIRPKHDLVFYINFLCLNILCIIIFWTSAYFDYINMINNGFVNKNAITFEVEEIKQPLIKVKNPFILFQYNSNMPEVKHVWINGEVKLPPIKEKDYVDINYNDNLILLGDNIDITVPSEYKVVRHFDTPNSYILNSEMWLISNKPDIDIKKGTHFTIITPNNNEDIVLKELFNQNTIKIKDKEEYGSYSLNSNKFLNVGMLVTIIFLIFIFILTSTLWINKERYFIRVLYLSGYPIFTIFIKIFQFKIFQYIIISIPLIFICVIVQKIIFPLWSYKWVFDSLYIFIGFIIYLLIFSFIEVFFYTVKKGGRRL